MTLMVVSNSLAAADNNLDEVLQGFDTSSDGKAASDTDSSLDAVLGGFDDAAMDDNGREIVVEQSPLQFGGALTLGTAYNYAHDAPATGETDYRGLSRLRAKLNLKLDADLGHSWKGYVAGYAYYDDAYRINGRDQYTREVLDESERETELGEAWMRGKLSSRTDLKLGRQIIIWGKSDNIRITDVINPLDNREPGMVDIEDLRLPLGMARLDYYVGDWGLTAMAIPEIRFNKNPPYGSDYYPAPAPMPEETIPSDGGNHTEYAFAANGIFSGWDLSLYWAQLYDDSPHSVNTADGPVLQHARLTMTGFATNLAVNNWLLKAEAARFSGLEYASLPGERFVRLDTLLGVEFSGLSETTLTLEVANRHINGYDEELMTEGVIEDEWQTALRYQGDFMHARLHLLALLSAFGDDLSDGGFGRYSVAYDIADALTATAGIVTYQNGRKIPFSTIDDNDRLFAELKYSF